MFKLEIKTGGAAFRDEEYNLDCEAVEIQRLLRQVQMKLSNGYTEGVLMDINGNKVGEWSYE